MASVTWTDNHDAIDYWQSNGNQITKTQCNNNVKVKYSKYTGYRVYSDVTSHRGKVETIDFGGRKVKKYQPFERWRLEFPATPTDQWYCSTAWRIWTQSHQSNGWYAWSKDYPSGNAKISGDICPFVHRNGMKYFAEKQRLFVERDLHIKANAPDFDGAVFLAELDETVKELYRIIKAPIEVLYKSRAKKKRPFLERKTGISNLLLNPEEAWLWFRYFLMPAMMDAEDIMTAIEGHRKINRVQAGDSSEGWTEMSGTSHFIYGSVFPGDLNWVSKYKFRSGGAMDIVHRFDPNRWGTSSWDVVRAAWERTPWSFVADWFVNFGDWLASLREIELEVAQSYASIAIEAETKVSPGSGNWHWSDSDVTFRTLFISRKVDIEPPALPLIDKRWRTINRTIDLISLTLALLKRSTKR